MSAQVNPEGETITERLEVINRVGHLSSVFLAIRMGDLGRQFCRCWQRPVTTENFISGIRDGGGQRRGYRL